MRNQCIEIGKNEYYMNATRFYDLFNHDIGKSSFVVRLIQIKSKGE